MYQWLNPPNSSPYATVQPIGELSGDVGSSLSGNPVSGRYVNWTVGYLNTTSTFAGTIRNDAGAAMLTKVGAGTLILSGTNTYTGATLISTGAVYGVTGGSISNSASITVASNATLGVQLASAGGQWVGTNLTFNAGSNYLAFNFGTYVPSPATPPMLILNNWTNNGTVYVNVSGGSGWATGVYPLARYTGAMGGSGTFAVGPVLPLRVAGVVSNDVASKSLYLVVTSVSEPLRWAAGDGVWDVATTANWKDAFGTATTYQEQNSIGDQILLEDTQSGASPTITLNSTVQPSSVTVSNNAKTYTLTGSGTIAGGTALTKTGTGTLVLGTANVFAGGINLNGGTVSFNALANLGAGAINFGGGTLLYNGNTDDLSVKTVNFNAGGAIINDGGNAITFANPVGNGGAGGLTKAGSGTLTLNGTNKYTGNTVVANGTLYLSANTYISNSAAIIVSSNATLDASSVGLTLAGAAAQILAGGGTINGSVICSNGIITPGTNGAQGTLTFNNDLTVAGGTVVMDVSTNPALNDLIVVAGNLNLYGGSLKLQVNVSGSLTNGVYKLIQYGGLGSGSGSSANLTLTGYTQSGKVLALSDANSGEIDLVVSSQSSSTIVWQGDGGNNYWDVATTANFTNSSGAAAVFNQGDKTIFNDSSANLTVNLDAALQPGSVTVAANNNSYIFQDGPGNGSGKLSGATGLAKSGSSTLVIATENNNSGGALISAGTVQVGNGGTYGNLGTGNVTNNAALVFYQGTDHVQSGPVSGSGSLTQEGSSVLTLAANNTYTGPTTINSGSVLQVGTGSTTGSLGVGAITNDGVLIYNRSDSLNVSGIKAGPGGSGTLVNLGAGTVSLGGGNTYVNNTAISNGVVKLTVSEAIPSSATVPSSSGWLVLDGGATAGTLDLNGYNQTVNALSGVSGTVNGLITNSAASGTNTLTTLNGSATSYYGLIADNAGSGRVQLVVRGANQLTLYSANTYSGGTIVGDTATLGLHNGSAAGTGGILMSNLTTLAMVGSTAMFPGYTVTIAPNSAAAFTSGSAASGFAGLVIGDGTATNTISGTTQVTLSSSSTKQYQSMTGAVVVAAGSYLRFSGSPLANGGDLTTFDVEGNLTTKYGGTVAMGALEGAGSISAPAQAGTATYIIGGNNKDTLFSGSINNGPVSTNIALVKTGTGTLTLSGTLSYLGSTTVSNGTLALQTPLDSTPGITLATNTAKLDISSSGLTMGNANSQTLSGFGTVVGALTVGSSYGCTINPGTAGTAGTLTVNGGLTLNGNTTNLMDFTSQNAVGGGTNDLIKVTGNLTLNGTVYLNPNFIGSGVTLGVPYTIIQYSGSLSGDAGNFALDQSAYSHLSATFSTSSAGAVTVTFLGGSNLVWVGDSTNSWQVGVVTNWFDGSSSNYFAQLDAVKFDNTASNFVVSLVGTNKPLSVTVNSSSNYMFSGSGKISGAASLAKAGTGTLILSNTGAADFSGATVVNNGILQLGNAGALSANSTLQMAGGSLAMAGYSASVGGLYGSSVIDNASATAVTLTVGNGGPGLWSGTITNSGTGGVSLTLNNTNTYVISGANRLNSGTASTVNNGAGTLIITNNGVVTLGAAEFWIGANAAVTGNVVVAGGTLICSNNYLVVGRNATNAYGTLVLNSGLIQKAGSNYIVVGSLGSSGTFTINGGQVLNNNVLVVGENATANANVNLNGGLLQAAQIRTNNAANSSVINFNGGTLQASAASANFIVGTTANVRNGGLVLDDNGYAIAIAQPLVAAGTGGLAKQGAGTVYLDAANSYTGGTVVSAGALAGTGSVVSPVTVAAAGTIGAGDASAVGRLTVANTVAINGKASMRLNKTGGTKTNDVLSATAITYGGTLAINNITSDSTALVAGDKFTLFTAASQSGAFTNISGVPGAGLGYTFTNGVLYVITTVATNPTNVTCGVSGQTLSLSWPSDHTGWTLQVQTNNLTTGLGTNWVDVAGSSSSNSASITVDPSQPALYFRLRY